MFDARCTMHDAQCTMHDARCRMQDVRLKIYKNEIMNEVRFKFEDLHIWQGAMDLGEEIYKLIKQFPENERFNLSSQILRAGDSIALNISEGSIVQSKPEFKRFMGYAIRSLAEVITCLHKAKRREYLTLEKFNVYYKESFRLMNMMLAFRKKI